MNRAKELLEKYFRNECSEEEKQFLAHWFHYYNLDVKNNLTPRDYQLAKEKFERFVHQKSKSNRKVLWYAAAAVLIVSCVSFFFADKFSDVAQITAVKKVERDLISPILVVDQSKEILLQDVSANIDEVSKVTSETGEVIYAFENKRKPLFAKAKINTVFTPLQQTLKAKLPDGSLVWLNGDSEISFKSNFNDNEDRVVYLKGEAYFEVAKNKEKPFKVVSASQTVQVLGTHFNVKTYNNKLFTSLLEGSVALSPNDSKQKKSKSLVLKPGQQATFVASKHHYEVSNFDVEKVLDWKYGDFIFKEDSLDDITAKLSEWYSVCFSFSDQELAEQTFSGRLSRANSLAEALNILERSCAVKFEKDGKSRYKLNNFEPNKSE